MMGKISANSLTRSERNKILKALRNERITPPKVGQCIKVFDGEICRHPQYSHDSNDTGYQVIDIDEDLLHIALSLSPHYFNPETGRHQKIRPRVRRADEETRKPGSDLPKALWRSYLETALWSSNHSAGDEGEYPDPRGIDDGEPYDSEYSPEDIDDKSLERMAKVVRKFLKTPGVKTAIAEAYVEYGQEDAQVGHDLWLTQNGHGAGFWDGDYGDSDDTSTPAYILTKASENLGEMNLTSYQPKGTEDPEDAQIEVM